jgi:hypothetical protein
MPQLTEINENKTEEPKPATQEKKGKGKEEKKQKVIPVKGKKILRLFHIFYFKIVSFIIIINFKQIGFLKDSFKSLCFSVRLNQSLYKRIFNEVITIA